MNESGTTVETENKELKLEPNDLGFFKDIGDVIRARNLFFVPFFGLFLTFLVARSDFVIKANPVIQVEAFITFLLGVYYSTVVSSLLSSLEILRTGYNMALNSKYGSKIREQLPTVLVSLDDLGNQIGPTLKWERRIFKWTMYGLWMTTGSTLIQIYFVTLLFHLDRWVSINVLR
jgi:hypothetical protein